MANVTPDIGSYMSSRYWVQCYSMLVAGGYAVHGTCIVVIRLSGQVETT